jgi:NHL repeat
MIRVYDVNGTQIRTISHADMKFPSSICIDYRDDAGETSAGELYALGPTDNYIRVFDLEGSLLRSFGGDVIKRGGMGGTTWYWREKFVRPQSVRIDSLGRAHVLDGFIGNIQILDRDTGTYISHYGAIGTNPGEFRIPIGIDINDMGDVAVSDYGNRRIQLLYTVPAPVQ